MADRLPLTRNVRWLQLAYGALLGILLYQFYLHATGAAPIGKGGMVARVMLLAVASLVFVIYLQNIYRFGLVPDYALKCRFCMGPVNRYSEFCEHCGADLIAEEKLIKCPKCEVDLYEDTKHCPECGARVAAAANDKGKKGHKKRREQQEQQQEGWDRPLDAVGPPPWEDR